MSAQTEVVKLDACTCELKVEVPAEETREEIQAAVRRLARKARIPGFRAGKVPPDIIRKIFAKEIREEATEELVKRAYKKAVEEAGLHPVRPGDIRDVALEGEGPIRFTARVEVEPEFALGDYKKAKVELPEVFVVLDEEVEGELQSLREANATLEPLDRTKGEEGDIALCDFIHLPHEEGDEPRVEENVYFEVGAKGNADALNQALRATPVGEVGTFHICQPESHPREDLRGKEIPYKVRVKALKARVLPALDDEFVRQVSDGKTLAELKDRIRQMLQAAKEAEAKRRARESVLEKLLEIHAFEVPGSLVEDRATHALATIAAQLERQGRDPGRMAVDWDRELEAQRKAARRSVRAQFLLKRIGEAEGIQVTDAEVYAEIQQIADSRGEPGDVLRARFEKDGTRGAIADGLYRRRILDFILRGATI